MSEANEQNHNEQLELERNVEQTRLQRIEAETQLLDRQAELEAAKMRVRRQHEDKVLREVVEAGPKWHMKNDEFFKLLRIEEYALEIEGEQATAVHNGQRISLDQFLLRLAEEKPFLVDGRSLRSIQGRIP